MSVEDTPDSEVSESPRVPPGNLPGQLTFGWDLPVEPAAASVTTKKMGVRLSEGEAGRRGRQRKTPPEKPVVQKKVKRKTSRRKLSRNETPAARRNLTDQSEDQTAIRQDEVSIAETRGSTVVESGSAASTGRKDSRRRPKAARVADPKSSTARKSATNTAAMTAASVPNSPFRDLAAAVEYLPLKWGARLPSVGFGFWKVDQDQAADVCYQAIQAGYRHLDCACDYGNEKEVGQGIQRAIQEGIVEREDLWITSKLWNTYHSAEHVRPACERSLQDLGLDYLDLYLIHFPIAQRFVPFEKRYPPGWFYDPDAREPVVEEARVSIRETWQAMEELTKEGLVSNIGICNFTTGQIRDLLTYAHIRPAVLQVETHPRLTQPKLLKYCQQEKIAYTAFSPLGAQSYYALNMAEPSESLLEHGVVVGIAEAVSKSPAQVLLRWGVQRGTAVIPKTMSRDRMIENLDLFDFALTVDQMTALDQLDEGRRYNDPGDFGEAAFHTFLPTYD